RNCVRSINGCTNVTWSW
ncbi:hypothetical protein BV054_00408B, partial [Haemophilus influenzae]